MASKVDNNNDDDSFIILDTPSNSGLDMEFNGVENGDKSENEQLKIAMAELSLEAFMAFKAHFRGDNPSPASMMVASTIVTDDNSIEALQKRFGELLDENIILKDTLKRNNDSLKEQLKLISSCQDDMLNTHRTYRDKFDATRNLVERLREENERLKQDTLRLSVLSQSSNDKSDEKSDPLLGDEFITLPDNVAINELTAQLALVEKQRRQVIVENEKLIQQKESLERIVTIAEKEKEEMMKKLKNYELQISNVYSEHAEELDQLLSIIQLDPESKESPINNETSTKALTARDQWKSKVIKLQNKLKMAQNKILQVENIKLQFAQHKSDVSETVNMYKEQIQDLSTRLKDAQTMIFQPVRLSVSLESESPSSSEFSSYTSNVKLYDRTLKHLAEFVNSLTSGVTDSLVQTIGTVASLYDYKLERGSVDKFKAGLAEVKQQLERQHGNVLNNVRKLRGMLSIFEDIFKDHNELLKKTLIKPEEQSGSSGVQSLTAALVARGHELQRQEVELQKLRSRCDDADLLRAQLLQYQSDFEVEREAREKMASEKDDILTDLRHTEKRLKELSTQMEEVRKLNPGIYHTVTNKKSSQQNPQTSGGTSSSPRNTTNNTTTTGNMVRKKKKLSPGAGAAGPLEGTPPPQRFVCPVCDQVFKTLIFLQQHVDGQWRYVCPKCSQFSSCEYNEMEDHFDICLGDF